MKIKDNVVIPHTQKMYKVGMGSGIYGLWSEDSLNRITPIVSGAIEYSHDRTIHYLDEEETENETNKRLSNTPRRKEETKSR